MQRSVRSTRQTMDNGCSDRGATTAEKLRGTKVWVPTPERLRPAPGPNAALGVGCGRSRPLPLCGSGGITPGKFVKTQMLNPAWWHLLWILAFRKLRPRIHTNTLDQSPPVPTVVAPICRDGSREHECLNFNLLWLTLAPICCACVCVSVRVRVGLRVCVCACAASGWRWQAICTTKSVRRMKGCLWRLTIARWNSNDAFNYDSLKTQPARSAFALLTYLLTHSHTVYFCQ